MAYINRNQRRTIIEAFNTYLNGLQDQLMEQGLDEDSACDLMFASADKFAEIGRLPPFPANESDYTGMGLWVVRAQDVDFDQFVVNLGERLNG